MAGLWILRLPSFDFGLDLFRHFRGALFQLLADLLGKVFAVRAGELNRDFRPAIFCTGWGGRPRTATLAARAGNPRDHSDADIHVHATRKVAVHFLPLRKIDLGHLLGIARGDHHAHRGLLAILTDPAAEREPHWPVAVAGEFLLLQRVKLGEVRFNLSLKTRHLGIAEHEFVLEDRHVALDEIRLTPCANVFDKMRKGSPSDMLKRIIPSIDRFGTSAFRPSNTPLHLARHDRTRTQSPRPRNFPNIGSASPAFGGRYRTVGWAGGGQSERNGAEQQA